MLFFAPDIHLKVQAFLLLLRQTAYGFTDSRTSLYWRHCMSSAMANFHTEITIRMERTYSLRAYYATVISADRLLMLSLYDVEIFSRLSCVSNLVIIMPLVCLSSSYLVTVNAAVLAIQSIDTASPTRSPIQILCYASIIASVASIITGLLIARLVPTKVQRWTLIRM
jgi:hypothetical protein